MLSKTELMVLLLVFICTAPFYSSFANFVFSKGGLLAVFMFICYGFYKVSQIKFYLFKKFIKAIF
jgi:hypothetical protein